MRRDHSKLAPHLEPLPKGRGKIDVTAYKMMRRILRIKRQSIHDGVQGEIFNAWTKGTGYMKIKWDSD